ncbi:target of EGR1 protein 1 isoform X1 [Electrophorus electricus]|uniref:target of EGR1 protein 1 isoform X1 n=1 Tax=Electrophorus electricus TaxID=8005 RepID=UPI0015D03B65|nr:target of EGR1 protein 1 isoform X1 [Electrophorus electricus]
MLKGVAGCIYKQERGKMTPTVVPVIDVQTNNFKELWPAMVLAFKTSSFIALDTELSGLGARKALLAESIEDRYKAICHAARTRSVLSLGIACYKKLDDKADSTYLVQVYNLTLLCTEEYIIEPKSVQFLVQHGFDFNKQYAQGVPYNKGNDKGGDAHEPNVRTLFVELLRANKPLVVHNGLIDMVFLYQCFYAHLPERLGTFVADLSEMFPGGIYDTKYATEYELRFTASYLEYAYKKCKLDNAKSMQTGGEGPCLFLEFCDYSGCLQGYVDYRPCSDSQSHDSSLNICVQFSAYGWCPNGSQCPMSHDTDLIIQQDEKTKEDKRKKRKRRKKQKVTWGEMGGSPQDKRAHLEDKEEDLVPAKEMVTCETSAPVSEHQQVGGKETDAICTGEPGRTHDKNGGGGSPAHGLTVGPGINTQHASEKDPTAASDGKVEGGTHRAGFDAFMTGYIFAFASILNQKPEESVAHPGIPGCQNKLYLSGKSVPLQVVKSTFSKSSKAHAHKMELVWGKKLL